MQVLLKSGGGWKCLRRSAVSYKPRPTFPNRAAHFIDFPFPLMSSWFCVLGFQAGDKHYHPSCARCSRCNQMFTEGEEMYLQGEWMMHFDLNEGTENTPKLFDAVLIYNSDISTIDVLGYLTSIEVVKSYFFYTSLDLFCTKKFGFLSMNLMKLQLDAEPVTG